MKKITTIMLGACALFSFSACSNDEPTVDNGGVVNKGDKAYLSVRIATPEDAGSRAADDSYGYEYGDAKEHAIQTAHFYFYDKDGHYVLTTNHWTSNGSSDENPNIEYKKPGLVVLEGLDGKEMPKYVVTVLNQANTKSFIPPTTLKGWEDISDWTCKNGDYYVMTTSSYLADADAANGISARKVSDGSYYATELSEENFTRTNPTDNENVEVTPVDIYVERLAARVQVKTSLTGAKVVDGKTLYKLPKSVGGNDNDEAKTDLYVYFEGWALSTTAKNSHAVKNLGDWTTSTKFNDDKYEGWKWNDVDYKRSYWGQAVTYGLSGDALVAKFNEGFGWKDIPTSAQVGDDKLKSAKYYCNENTNTLSNILSAGGTSANPQYATTVLLRAVVCDENANPVNLVTYRTITYTWDGFKDRVLNFLNLQYYTQAVKETHNLILGDATEPEPVIEYEYTQLSKNDVELALYGEGTGYVKLVVKDGVKLYTLTDDYDETTGKDTEGNVVTVKNRKVVEANNEDVNDALLAAHANNNKANAYKDGAMFYPIVIEHLNYKLVAEGDGVTNAGKKDPNDKLVVREAQIGVVRNHSYTINITKLNNLGQGVFNPEKVGDTSNPGEVLIPEDPKEPTYYVESTINVLSWKLVEQESEI